MTIYKGRLINQETQDIMYPQTSYDMIDGAPESMPANGGSADTATKLSTARKINGTDFDGTGDIETENWGKSRSITIGNSKKSVDGSSDTVWTLDEIGSANKKHTHGIDDVDIDVGGRNFLLNSTGNLGTNNNWNNNILVDTSMTFDNHNTLKLMRTDYSTGNSRMQGSQTIINTSLRAGDYVTISGWIYINSSVELSGTTNDICLRNHYNDGDFEDLCKFNFGSLEKDTWVYFSATSKLTKDPQKFLFLISINQNGMIWLSKLKFEKGNIATDWTFAQEDIDSKVEQALIERNYVNENILLNSDFSSGIINQQGLSKYTNTTSKSKLSVDMWVMNGLSAMTMTINDNSITFDATSITEDYHSIYQRVDCDFEEGQKLCLRAYVDNKYYDYIFEFNKTDSFVSETFDGKFRFNSNWSATYNCLAVRFSVAKGQKITLHKMKLEYGSVFTGMPVWREAEQLLKCMSYYQILYRIPIHAASTTATTYFIDENMFIPMRKSPSYTVTEVLNSSVVKQSVSTTNISLTNKELINITLSSSISQFGYITVYLDAYDY